MHNADSIIVIIIIVIMIIVIIIIIYVAPILKKKKKRISKCVTKHEIGEWVSTYTKIKYTLVL